MASLSVLCVSLVVFTEHVSRVASSCPVNKFHCDGGRCISTRWRCDGAFDCRDHSDETECEAVTCGTAYSRCNNGQCVPNKWWCDGQTDCTDNSDEDVCGETTPSTTTTTTTTTTTPAVISNGIKKVDMGGLDKNTAVINSSKPVVADDVLDFLVSKGNTWFKVGADENVDTKASPKLEVKSGLLGKILEFDVDPASRTLCWSDNDKSTVMCMTVDGLKTMSPRLLDSPTRGARNPHGVSIDPLLGNVYWTDSGKGSVSVGSALHEGRGKKTLLEGKAGLRSIVVDPQHRFLYVTEGRRTVVRYQMTGREGTVIVERNIGYISDLAIDSKLGRLFWVDPRNQSISSCRMNGEDRMRNFELSWRSHVGLEPITDADNQTHIYTISNDKIVRFSMTSDDTTRYDLPNYLVATSLRLYNTSIPYTDTDPCADLHCSHLCLPGNQPHSPNTCQCPDHYNLVDGTNTCRYAEDRGRIVSVCRSSEWACSGNASHCVPLVAVCDGRNHCQDGSDEGPFCSRNAPLLLTVEDHVIKKTSLNSHRHTGTRLVGQNNLTAHVRLLDVDSRLGKVYLASENSIIVADLSKTLSMMNVRTIMQRDGADIADMALDWNHGLLYWVDRVSKAISVTTTDGSFSTELFRENNPGPLALHPRDGYMILANRGSQGFAEILKVNLDGTHRTVLVKGQDMARVDIGGFAIDFGANMLYWTVHTIKAIMSVSLTGRGGWGVASDPNQGTMGGVSFFRGYMYVSDTGQGTVRRYKPKGKIWQDVRLNATGVTDTAILHKDAQPKVFVSTPSQRCSVDNGGCSHVCLPPNMCLCPPPMVLRVFTCVYQEMLLISDGSNLNRADLRSSPTFNGELSTKSMEIPAGKYGSLKQFKAFDFDIRNNRIIWADTGFGGIYMGELTNKLQIKSRVELFRSGVGRPEAVAMDWVEQNIYWSDSIHHSICVGSVRTRNKRTLHHTGEGVVTGLAVNPKTRYVYWTIYGSSMYSAVERSRMDGSHREVVLTTGLITPVTLTVDYETDRLFIGDAGSDVIMSCDKDGDDCYSLSLPLANVNLVSIVVHQGYVYWSDSHYKQVRRMGKRIGLLQDRKTLVDWFMDVPRDITIFHPDRQPMVPPMCDSDNNGWMLCLPGDDDKPHQACPDGSVFQGDGISCDGVRLDSQMGCQSGYTAENGSCRRSRHSLLACRNNSGSCTCAQGYQPTNITRCSLEGPAPKLLVVDGWRVRMIDQLDDPAPRIRRVKTGGNTGMVRPVSVDFDTARQRIFWTDRSPPTIKMATFRGRRITNPKVLVKPAVTSLEGVAYDWSRNLLYWVELRGRSRGGAICVISVQQGHVRTLHSSLDRPRSIVVHPDKGYMFWSSWGARPSLERSGLDGSDRHVIVNNNIMWPNGLTIDYSEGRVYWTDGAMGSVSSCELDGADRRVVIFTHTKHQLMFAVAAIQDLVYWTDWKDGHLHRVTKVGHNRTVIPALALRRSTDAKILHPSRQMTGRAWCGDDNGGCSHICAPSPSAGRAVCLCPDNFTLDQTGLTCLSQPD